MTHFVIVYPMVTPSSTTLNHDSRLEYDIAKAATLIIPSLKSDSFIYQRATMLVADVFVENTCLTLTCSVVPAGTP